jgi:L-asparaginase
MTEMNKKRIHILATGGTIAGLADSPLDFLGYTAGAAGIESLLQSIPEIYELAELQVENFCGIASENGNPELWLRIARCADELLGSENVDGLVITAGTDTLEELAYFLNLLLKSEKPVVLVGAMRPLSAYGTDGPVNLYNAVSVASAADSCGKGVLVVMNDTILSARGVTKQDSFRVHTFGGGDFGTLGFVVAGDVHFTSAPWHKHTSHTELFLADIAANSPSELPKVEIFYMSGGADARLLTAMADLGAQGVVVAGFGNGTYSDAVGQELVGLIAGGVVCVVCSRTYTGFAKSNLPGLIAGSDLSPQKARVLLLAALACGKSAADIERCFREY